LVSFKSVVCSALVLFTGRERKDDDRPTEIPTATVSCREAASRPAGVGTPAASARTPKLMDQLHEALRSRHYSQRTEQTYCHWVKQFILFSHHSAPGPNSKRMPVVMKLDEVKAVLSKRNGDKWFIASLMYGADAGLLECLRLRVQDVDFARKELPVRDGKVARDRVTMLPVSLKAPLRTTSKRSKRFHQRDWPMAGAACSSQRPGSQISNAPKDWCRQWLFPPHSFATHC